MNPFVKKYDQSLALGFGALSLLFIAAMTYRPFFDWAFARHHNLLSWYIRPLFLIPFSYFAYRRSLAGIFATIFLLLTSMFWFPAPTVIDEMAATFLAMEQVYLTSDWTLWKLGTTALVPISLWAFAAALWLRSIRFGMGVVIFMAVAKLWWSVLQAGDAGLSILAPAVVGLALCVLFLYWRFYGGVRFLQAHERHRPDDPSA
jgi:hypothetical protein